MNTDIDMLFLSYLASWQKEKSWYQAGKRAGHYLADILNLFVYQIRNSRLFNSESGNNSDNGLVSDINSV